MQSQHYMDKGKPTLAWSIIAAAGHMCLSLDFHRDSPLEPESVETRRRRIRLFWAVCLSEKSLALRLGRPSTIRNSEITIPRVFDDCDEGGSSPVLQRWIDVALLQDRVYDDIYSPSALSLPEDVRIMRARNLAAEMQKTFEHGTPLEVGPKIGVIHFVVTKPRAVIANEQSRDSGKLRFGKPSAA